MENAEQLPFNLTPRPAYEREDFFVSASNQDAISWIDKWPDWGTPSVLIIIGEDACGKTHLSKVWQKEASALEIAPNNMEQSVYMIFSKKSPKVTIDDIDSIIGDLEKEKQLFHIYNIVKENNGSLLLTIRKPVKEYNFLLPDLKSRLMAASAVTILPPDEDLMAIVLTKIFSDKQMFVSQDVIKYIIPRIERSLKAVRDLAEKIDYKSLTDKKSVTITMVKSILDSVNQ